MAAKAKPMSRVDPELLTQLHELNLKREQTNMGNANVTMEELGEAPVKPDSGSEPKPDPDGEDNN